MAPLSHARLPFQKRPQPLPKPKRAPVRALLVEYGVLTQDGLQEAAAEEAERKRADDAGVDGAEPFRL
eukprot:7342822-Alexandrium_andersonii.AAC.1